MGVIYVVMFLVILVGGTAMLAAPVVFVRQLTAPARRPPNGGTVYPGRSLLYIPLFLFIGLAILGFSIYQASVAAAVGGSLPWPLAQWAFTTPLGVVGLALLSFIALAPFYLVPANHAGLLERARDITGLPLDAWPPRPPMPQAPAMSLAERWLGRDRRERTLSLLALGAAAVIIIGFIVAVVAALSLNPPPAPCGPVHCAPAYPTLFIVLGCLQLVLGVFPLNEYLWARRVGRRAGVRLLHQRAGLISGINYIRDPGVSHEQAEAALIRAIPARRALARDALLGVLQFAPMLLLLCGAVALAHWLPALWRP